MARPSKYTPELRERVVRMVMESRRDYPHEAAAIRSDAAKLGITSTDSLRKWVRQVEIDGGVRPGKTSEEISENKALKKEVAELRRVNEVLKAGRCRTNLAMVRRFALWAFGVRRPARRSSRRRLEGPRVSSWR